MAQLLTGREWPMQDSLGLALSEVLPDDYVVAEHPLLLGRVLDLVVAGPQGLFVLLIKEWEGEIRPAWGGPWEILDPASEAPSIHANPAQEARQVASPLAAFARDVLQSKDAPAIYHFLVLTHPSAQLAPGMAPDILVATPSNVGDVIVSTPVPEAGGLSPDQRLGLARALDQGATPVSQRTTKPFVFRTAGLLRSSKAWTIRDAVLHMDRHPQDGVYHLSNGTLAAWLEAEGAVDLADLARGVLRSREDDPRVSLEKFLLGTGLVERPPVNVRPQHLNLGRVVAGGSCSGRVRLSKGRGRGYLFGTLSTSEPWLRVEPREFRGGPLEAVVTVDASGLSISAEPWQADLLIATGAADEPVAVPVHVRVSGDPSRLSRYGVRPLLDGLLSGAIGAGLGLLLGASGGLRTPAPFNSPALFWALAIGLLWGGFGLVRGLGQRPAWRIRYATVRYAFKIGLWLAVIGVAAAAGLVIWKLVLGEPGTSPFSRDGWRLILTASTLAIIPATLGERRAARQANDSPIALRPRVLLQPLLFGLVAIALVATLAFAARLAGPAWQQASDAGSIGAAQTWIGGRLQALNDLLQGLVDRIYLEQYDPDGRFAPTATPAVDDPSAQ